MVLQHGHNEKVLVAVKNASRELVSRVQLQHLHHIAGAVVQHHVLVLTVAKVEGGNGSVDVMRLQGQRVTNNIQ